MHSDNVDWIIVVLDCVPEIFKDHAQVTLVLEIPLQPDDVFLILRVGSIECTEDSNFLQSSLFPARSQLIFQYGIDNSYIVSLLRIILIATSFFVTESMARTTAENMPLPRLS